MTETEACLVLNLLPNIGPIRFARLKKAFGSAQTILLAKKEDLCAIKGIGAEVAHAIKTWEEQLDLAGEIKSIDLLGARVLTATDLEYPSLLKEIYDPPILLYVLGSLEERDQKQGIGIVGTRTASHYALEATKKLGYQLAYSGLTVYSGLARGIDTIAHQAALAAHGRTVAVLGGGLGKIYPPENKELAQKIATSGAVITEYPMNKAPSKQTFPKRNRIISGCSFGLLVVEAGIKSGALISAQQAEEQGRSLYVVPGRIDQVMALGSNRLIQQGAKLVMDAADILSDFPLLFQEQPILIQSQPKSGLSETDLLIYNAIKEDPTPIDEIVIRSTLSAATVSARLLGLELRGYVKVLPGSRFTKLL